MKNRSGENFISLIVCLIVMLVFSVLSMRFSFLLGLIEVICVALLAMLCMVVLKNNHGNISTYIEDLTFHVDNATKESLLYAPMPVVILKRDGHVLWYNSNFDKLFDNQELFNLEIEKIFKNITIEKLFKTNFKNFECFIKNKHYTVMSNCVKFDKKDEETSIAVLYLFDDNNNYNYQKMYDEDRPVIAIVSIDNYEDILISTPETHKSLLVAEMENRIYKYFEFAECVIKKFEQDKYIVFMKYKYLDELIDDKFSLLDKVKEIKCGNKFSPTLSIGIGVNKEGFGATDDYADSAITLALGRGGDQVVIKSFENVAYYGGKTREHEKTTKVKARVTAMALRELIEHSSNVIVMGHKYPDMDCIGAAIGICAFSRSLNVKSDIVYDNTSQNVNQIINRIYENNKFDKFIITRQEAEGMMKKDTLLVVVDTHRPYYTEYPDLLDEKHSVVLIDHHRRGAEFIQNTCLVYHEPYASSTCEMVSELLQYLGDDLKISSQEAEALYAGIMLDTKDFAMKTGVRTFEAAAFLKRLGVDIETVRRFFRNDFQSFVKVAKVVAGAEVYHNNIAISECRKNDNVDVRIIAPQSADKLLSISGIEASFVITETNNETIISGRASGNINVQLILEKLGGGGHQTIAGVQLPKCPYEEAREKLIKSIDEYMKEQEE